MSIALLATNVGSFGLLVTGIGTMHRVTPAMLRRGTAPLHAPWLVASIDTGDDALLHVVSPSTMAVSFALAGHDDG
jgi:hypothetical protein